MQDVLVWSALMLAGLTTGSEASSYFFLRPGLNRLPWAQFTAFERDIQALFSKFMPILMIVTTILALLTVIWLWGDGGAVRWLSVIAALGYVAANAITIIFMLPINAQTGAAKPPANWKALRRRWEQLQGMRTAAMLLALAALSGAAVLRG
jgi:uncharacterized membrane protein